MAGNQKIKSGSWVKLRELPEGDCKNLDEYKGYTFLVQTIEETVSYTRIKIIHPATDSPTWFDVSCFEKAEESKI